MRAAAHHSSRRLQGRVHETSSLPAISSYSIVKRRALAASAYGCESVTATANAGVGLDAPSSLSRAAMLGRSTGERRDHTQHVAFVHVAALQQPVDPGTADQRQSAEPVAGAACEQPEGGRPGELGGEPATIVAQRERGIVRRDPDPAGAVGDRKRDQPFEHDRVDVEVVVPVDVGERQARRREPRELGGELTRKLVARDAA